MAMPSPDYVEQYWDQGYAVLRGFLPRTALGELQAETRRLYAEGLKHPTTYRDRNLLFEILPELLPRPALSAAGSLDRLDQPLFRAAAAIGALPAPAGAAAGR